MTPLSKSELRAKACAESHPFLDSCTSLADAWDKCQHSDWMLWALDKIGWSDDRIFRLFACWCALEMPLADGRKTGDLLTDPRSREAVEVARRFANGEATREELAAAWAAAWSAAWSEAAWSAEWAAAWAAAESAAWSAESAARSAEADQLRTLVGANPFAYDAAMAVK